MSSTEVDSGMWMGNLSEFILDDKKVVTYKWLSRELKVHVNVAKQMLFAFLQENLHKKLKVTYLLAGKLCSNGEQRVVVVDEKDVESVSSNFQTLSSKHVYSISASAASPTTLFTTDLNQMKEDPYLNTLSSIKYKNAVPRSNSDLERVRETFVPKVEEPKKEVVEAKKKKEPEVQPAKKKVNDIGSMFSVQTSKKKNEGHKAEDTKEKTSVKESKTKSGGIAGFFGKAQPKPVIEEPQKQEESPGTSPGKENKVNQQIEEENKRKRNTEAKNAKKRGKAKDSQESEPKRRRRIQVMSDSESSEGEDEAAVKEEQEELERMQVHAPTDRSEELASAIISDDDDELIPATPASNSGSKCHRRRVKKMVDKTYADEDGFMVTKKEVEWFSESEEEEDKVVAKKEEPQKVEKKKPAGSPQKNKQASIMNFFKKK